MSFDKKLNADTIESEMKKLLNRTYHYNINHISGVPSVTCFYFQTNKDLQHLSQEQKNKIKSIYIDYLKRKGYIPQELEESEIEVYFDSIENSRTLSAQIKQHIEECCGCALYRIDTSYSDTNVYGKPLKSCMTWIYFKTNAELQSFSTKRLDDIKKAHIDFLKEKKYIPQRIDESKITIYFDTDENVQKNYGGSYFYATR